MNKNEAKEIISSTFSSDFDGQRYKKFVSNLFKKYEPTDKIVEGQYIKLAYKSFVIKYKIIGTFEDKEGHKIDILEVNLNKASTLERARTAQRNFVAEYLKDRNKDAALVAFVSPDNQEWRLSLVKLESFLEVIDEKLKTKEEITPAKRWSFLVGKNEGSHTAQSRFVNILISDEDPNLAELESAFDIETVTKEFFHKYTELYFQLKDHLDSMMARDEIIKKDFEEKEISTIDFAKKTLGQIVFLYFLQKKGWFGVSPDKQWGEGPKRFLREVFERKEKYGTNFFNDILEPLFYEALAQDRGTESIYSRLNNCRMPFLNGGLFDPMNGYLWETTDIIIPDELFSNDHPTKEGDKGTGILDVFDRYNFTVNENEPLEKEVAVDPEMLGKVFENLLDIKDRKSKGAFYTPREIVHYMCQESLINYLNAETNNEIPRNDLELFIQKGDRIIENDKITLERQEERIKKYGNDKYKDSTYSLLLPISVRTKAEKLDELLKNIKVADPAVGSGAFPLGMINEIVRARKVLNVYLKSDISDYELKKHTITHSIYGVDIDPGAVDIAKLRLWLALVVDEEIPHPLPNLEHKIMQGNSLISEYEEIKLFDESIFEEDKKKEMKQAQLGLGKTSSELKMETLQNRIASFVNESQRTKKQNLKKEIDDLKWELIEETLKEQGKEDKLEDIKKLRRKNIRPFFIWKLEFSDVFKEKGGFDIVIGNPPYISALAASKSIDKNIREYYKSNFISASGTYDIYLLFFEQGISLLKKDGSLIFITPTKYLSANYAKDFRDKIGKSKLKMIVDFSRVRVFESAGVTTFVSMFSNSNLKEDVFSYMYDQILNFNSPKIIKNKRSSLDRFPESLWGHLITENFYLLDKIFAKSDLFKSCFSINGSSTASEADNFCKYINGNKIGQKIINTGSISPFVSRWSEKAYSNKKEKILKPYMDLKMIPVRRKEMYLAKKLIISKLAKNLTCVVDNKGEYASTNTTFVYDFKNEELLKFTGALINSRLYNFIYKNIFSGLNLLGSFQFQAPQIRLLPFPKKGIIEINNISEISKLVDKIMASKNLNPDDNILEIEDEINNMIYKLYDLTSEEIEIVENSSKK